MKNFIIIILGFVVFASCGKSNKDKSFSLLQKWIGKELSLPARSVFTIQGKDTVEYPIQNAYKILTYIDSTGCTSCKLKLAEWEKFITVVDSIRPHTVQFLFFLCPKNGMEIYQTLRVERFKHPICIDEGDNLNKLNHFPADMAFQTFLLDNDNRVVAMGNPIHNLKVRELYLKIIQGREVKSDDEDNVVQTIVDVDKVSTSMGNFDWQKEQKVTFIMKNVGDKLLAIEGVDTSCGCISVEYSKEPVRPGMDLNLSIIYKAEHPEHFSKTVRIHCNSESSPIILTVSGNAQ